MGNALMRECRKFSGRGIGMLNLMSEFRTSARQPSPIMQKTEPERCHEYPTASVVRRCARVTANSTAAFRRRLFHRHLLPPGVQRPHAEAGKLHLLSEAAAAELAGFRPCLKCRPELAPGLALIDLGNRYAQVAVQLIEQGYLSEHSCEALAARLGISDRHLRRIFAEQFGASPIDYAQSHRLLQVKRLLADTDLPLSEVAFAAGFGSLRRFNELFKARYRLIPSAALRSGGARGERAAASGLVFHLGYRPPYDWDRMLNFLQARAVQGVAGRGPPLSAFDLSQSGRYGVLRLAQRAAGRSAQPGQGRDRAGAQFGDDGGAAPRTLAVRFDAAPDRINEALGSLAADAPGLRLPGCVNSFEQAARAVLGQLVSVKMAATFAGRMAERWGGAGGAARGHHPRFSCRRTGAAAARSPAPARGAAEEARRR